MNNKEKASISIKKIVCTSIILILLSGIVVMAADIDLNDVDIVLQNGYELKVLTSKSKVSEVFSEQPFLRLIRTADGAECCGPASHSADGDDSH